MDEDSWQCDYPGSARLCFKCLRPGHPFFRCPAHGRLSEDGKIAQHPKLGPHVAVINIKRVAEDPGTSVRDPDIGNHVILSNATPTCKSSKFKSKDANPTDNNKKRCLKGSKKAEALSDSDSESKSNTESSVEKRPAIKPILPAAELELSSSEDSNLSTAKNSNGANFTASNVDVESKPNASKIF